MTTLTDLFAGAGGSSTGARDAGVQVRMAANHWALAVDTHNTNHPDTDHDCADISQVEPRRYPHTDILWASPECTNHSRAKGRKRADSGGGQGDPFRPLPDEAATRSRATMYDVPRFAEFHQYRAIVVENVVEVTEWAPFQGWLVLMDALGYHHKTISLNSMHAQAHGLPAAQSRDRVYIAFWRKGDRAPDFEHMQRPLAYCSTCDATVQAMQAWKNGRKVGRYRAQYVYRCPNVACRNQVVEPGWLPATSIIDWSLPGMRIGDRVKPLADKTRRRIAAGIARYWSPVHLEAAGHTYDAADPKHASHGDPNAYYRAWPVGEPLKTLHTNESKALAIPVEGRDGKQPQPMGAPLRTQTTRLETAVAYPPFIAELRGGGSTARPSSRPLATVTASGNHHALVMRNNTGGAAMCTPVGEPIRTLTTTGHQSLLTPGDLAATEARVDDVLFRMLEPTEVMRGMAFPADYVMLGNRREQVKLSGNAVTPPAARDLLATVVEALS